jgi:hypothetical protein
MTGDRGSTGRILTGLTHGGHAVSNSTGAADRAKIQESISLAEDVGRTEEGLEASTPFGSMFDARPASGEPVGTIGDVLRLAAAM